MEYACKAVGVKIIVVLGHTKCGAVKGAVHDVKMGNLTQLLSKIEPAIEATKKQSAHSHLSDGDFTEAVAEANVRLVAEQISEKSAVLRGMLEKGEIGIVSGIYNVESGHVDFYDDEVTMFKHKNEWSNIIVVDNALSWKVCAQKGLKTFRKRSVFQLQDS